MSKGIKILAVVVGAVLVVVATIVSPRHKFTISDQRLIPLLNMLLVSVTALGFVYFLLILVLPSSITRRIIPYKTAGRFLVRVSEALSEPKTRESLRSVLAFVLIVAGFWFIYTVWNFWDESGWHSHSRETLISAKSDWLEGESKTCFSEPVDQDTARIMKVDRYDVTTAIHCDNGDLHQIKVTFWGRTTRPEDSARYGVRWKCVKKPGEFVCYALD